MSNDFVNQANVVLLGITVFVIGLAMIGVVVEAVHNAEIEDNLKYLGNLAISLYVLGVALLAGSIVFIGIKYVDK